MQEKKFVTSFRHTKIVQLSILLTIDIVFFLILLCNPSTVKYLYSSKPLFLLCAIVWVLMLFHLVCLIYDFFKLRSFALESHALNKLAYLDELTGIPNRHGLDMVFRAYNTPESMANIGCYMATIDSLARVNDELGRDAGNELIQAFCSILERVGDGFGTVGRNGGNEFLCILNPCNEEILQRFTRQLDEEIAAYNLEHPNTPIHISSTCVQNSAEKIQAFPELLIVTYNRLYS